MPPPPKCHVANCPHYLHRAWDYKHKDHLACPAHGYSRPDPHASAQEDPPPQPLTAKTVEWLRSYAASMWTAMRDDVDAEEFESDRDQLCAIAAALETQLGLTPGGPADQPSTTRKYSVALTLQPSISTVLEVEAEDEEDAEDIAIDILLHDEKYKVLDFNGQRVEVTSDDVMTDNIEEVP